MPAGVTDPYTPDGCPETEAQPESGYHVTSETYHPTYYRREVEQQ